MVKHQDQGTFQEDGSIWAYASRGMRDITIIVGKHGSRQARWLEQQAESSQLKQLAGSRESKLETVWPLKVQSPSPVMTFFLKQGHTS